MRRIWESRERELVRAGGRFWIHNGMFTSPSYRAGLELNCSDQFSMAFEMIDTSSPRTLILSGNDVLCIRNTSFFCGGLPEPGN
ncbi:unnamed protein product [Allacma fusca]|uniref:Uncharacterized protein n=1 Tax=Allacma fusca TaxID=39272 RepID=A0A8J2P0R1_9HEXA|nr:unnamed protein product [Allacma fusca]